MWKEKFSQEFSGLNNEEAKEVYKKLSRKFHPDKISGLSSSDLEEYAIEIVFGDQNVDNINKLLTEIFQWINQVYENTINSNNGNHTDECDCDHEHDDCDTSFNPSTRVDPDDVVNDRYSKQQEKNEKQKKKYGRSVPVHAWSGMPHGKIYFQHDTNGNLRSYFAAPFGSNWWCDCCGTINNAERGDNYLREYFESDTMNNKWMHERMVKNAIDAENTCALCGEPRIRNDKDAKKPDLVFDDDEFDNGYVGQNRYYLDGSNDECKYRQNSKNKAYLNQYQDDDFMSNDFKQFLINEKIVTSKEYYDIRKNDQEYLIHLYDDYVEEFEQFLDQKLLK